MEYRKRCYADEDGGTLPKESLQEDLARFHRIDKDNTGSITWWEFINFESIRILKKRSKVIKNGSIKFLILRRPDG